MVNWRRKKSQSITQLVPEIPSEKQPMKLLKEPKIIYRMSKIKKKINIKSKQIFSMTY